jgi:hypothetical protein
MKGQDFDIHVLKEHNYKNYIFYRYVMHWGYKNGEFRKRSKLEYNNDQLYIWELVRVYLQFWLIL